MKTILNFAKGFFIAVLEGVLKVAESVEKTGVIPHLFAFWCIGWGIIGIVYYLFMFVYYLSNLQ